MSEISTGKMLGQVALTYVQRPVSSWFYKISTALYLFMYFMALCSSPGRKEVYESFHAMGIFFVVMMLAGHWKQQMSYPQARLIPRYRALSTVVFACAVALVILPMVAVFSFRFGLDVGLMILAIDTLIAAVILWLAVGPGATWLGVLFVLGWMWAISESGRIAVTAFLLKDHGARSLALFGIGVCCLVGLIWRLWRSDDETPRFLDNTLGGPRVGAIQSQSSEKLSANRLVQFLFYPTSLQLARCREQRTSWQQIRRWQIGMMSIRLDIFLAAGFVLLGAVLAAMYPDAWFVFSPLVTICSISIPAFLMGVSIAQRIRRISSDFMLPVGRRDYFRQMFLLCALSYLRLWILFAAVTILFTLALLRPQDHAVLPLVLFFSLAFNVLNYGACMWLSRVHTIAALMFAFFSNTSLPLIIVPFNNLIPHPSELLLLGIFSTMTLTGILLAFDAYRRWLKMEIGAIASAGDFVIDSRRSRKLVPQLSK